MASYFQWLFFLNPFLSVLIFNGITSTMQGRNIISLDHLTNKWNNSQKKLVRPKQSFSILTTIKSLNNLTNNFQNVFFSLAGRGKLGPKCSWNGVVDCNMLTFHCTVGKEDKAFGLKNFTESASRPIQSISCNVHMFFFKFGIVIS